MKTSLFFLTFLFILLQISCIKYTEPIPPLMNITPEDTVEISVLNPVVYDIYLHSNEELQTFKMTSKPSIFKENTAFEMFLHDIDFSLTLNLPNVISDFYIDSLIVLTFEVYDGYTTTTDKRYMKVTQGYPQVVTKTISLETPPGQLFYSFSSDSLYLVDDENRKNSEIAYIWEDLYGHVLCSPDSKWLNTQINNYFPYETSLMKHTKIQKLHSDWEDIDAKYLYEFVSNDNYINGNQNNGVGINLLATGQVIGFQLIDGRKGALEITSVAKSTNKITFNIKIQKNAL